MKQLLQFLGELKEHNEREWFQANKQRYRETRATFEAFTGKLIDRVTAFDPGIAGASVKECVFRVYRDTRFSPDKRPYKTHAGAFITRGGKNMPRGGYYLHVEPGNSLLAGGIWCPDAALLRALRRDVYDNIEEFLSIIRDPAFALHYALDDGYMLKRVPYPFPPDDPAAAWTRYKSYTAARFIPDALFEAADAVEQCADMLRPLYPFNQFLNYTVDESTRDEEYPAGL
ncbi:MAG: DUF2461 domain-containing protein [Odoribacteraceae bacterium]|jgi:uncharacterized protein (TIGR02453 family)|nr:DUF2461 domain-containing protein [Odoribacteraceae bacterium]